MGDPGRRRGLSQAWRERSGAGQGSPWAARSFLSHSLGACWGPSTVTGTGEAADRQQTKKHVVSSIESDDDKHEGRSGAC